MTTIQDALQAAMGIPDEVMQEAAAPQKKTLDELKAEDEAKHLAAAEAIAARLDFTVQDCIHFRQVVLDFYNGIEGARRKNVISTEHPAEDVVGDVQLMMYIALLYRGHEEMEKAIAETMPDGLPVIRKQAKPWIGYYRKTWQSIARHIPVNDVTYICGYAQIDELIGDALEALMQKTYYPILNSLLKETPDVDSAILRVLAHGITSLTFTVLAVQCGMKDGHHVYSDLLDKLYKCTVNLIACLPSLWNRTITMNDDTLASIERTCKVAVVNITNPILEGVYLYAGNLDLTDYVERRDISLEDIKQWRNAQAKMLTRRVMTTGHKRTLI